MSSQNSLGDRMKGYEAAQRTTLPGRLPIVLRVDGKAFHTYTRGCQKPFDPNLEAVMNLTATALCESIQGAQLAYVQSDEISVLIHTYKRFNSSSWFDNQIQKMTSISAAIASTTFTMNSWRIWKGSVLAPIGLESLRPALFDSRVFVVPEADVCNYFLWRQLDASHNSVQMLARSLYSHKQLHGMNVIKLQEMIKEKGQDWATLPASNRHGRCIVKQQMVDVNDMLVQLSRTRWVVDNNIPSFKENRNYINDLLQVEEQ